jgi:hypothetical protein
VKLPRQLGRWYDSGGRPDDRISPNDTPCSLDLPQFGIGIFAADDGKISILAGTVTLNETQQRDRRSLGMPVLLPTYLPPGFQLAEVKILQEGMKGYTILFESANNGCFLVEATNGGIGGGIELESTLPITAKFFGEGYALNYGLPKDPELRQQFPEADLYSDWMKLDRYFYRLSGALMAREEYDYANCRYCYCSRRSG